MNENDEVIVDTRKEKKKDLRLWEMKAGEEINFPSKYKSTTTYLSGLNKFTPRTYRVTKYTRSKKGGNELDDSLTVERVN